MREIPLLIKYVMLFPSELEDVKYFMGLGISGKL